MNISVTSNVNIYDHLAKTNASALTSGKSIGQLKNEGAFKDASALVQMEAYLASNFEGIDSSIHLSRGQAQGYRNGLDGNQDGVLTKDELKKSLAGINAKIASANQANLGQSMQEKINSMALMSQFGEQLLNAFDGIAGQDGKAGISEEDINKLAAQYGEGDRITGLDLYKANDPSGYANFQAQFGGNYQSLDSKYGAVRA